MSGAYLGWRHPMATVARRMCASTHRLARNRKLGEVACGRCWERVIRADERFAIAFELDSPHPAPDQTYVDQIAVDRYLAGERLRLAPADRAEITRRNSERHPVAEAA